MTARPACPRPTADLLAVLAAESRASEQARQLSAASVAAMRDLGLFRLLVPQRAGGLEGSLGDMADCVRSCAGSCSAAGWVLMVSTAHDLVVGSFPEAAQDEVWARGPDGVLPGSLAPSGTMVPVDGGFRLEGRWGFNSGAAHGDWFLLGTADRSGERPRLYHVVVPRADLDLDDNWHTIGLRGTGSVDALARDIFVPAHRALDSAVLLAGRSEWAGRHASDLYRTPIIPGLAAHISAAALGIARPALDAALLLLTGQKDRYTGRPKQDRPGIQMRLAEAEAELACAEHMLRDSLELLATAAGGADSRELRARAKFQAAYATELCRRAVERLIAATGARSAFDDSPLQRAFRDLTMGCKHEMANLDNAALTHGRMLLGLDPGGAPL